MFKGRVYSGRILTWPHCGTVPVAVDAGGEVGFDDGVGVGEVDELGGFPGPDAQGDPVSRMLLASWA